MTLTTAGKPGESDAQLMNRAVADTVTQLAQGLKAPPPVPTSAKSLTAHFRANSFADWIAMRNRLAAVSEIRSSELVSLDRYTGRVAIRYQGAPEDLRKALQQHDLDLTGSDPDWALEARGPPAAGKH
jgi:hypothetical protein